ncbi:penicillin-binding protein 1A [Terrihabitans rhizophilus]|uniref:Penicillin-binding protein 1A n=1 Tax=Terrihabitans rhizophilus TaxID=3092662 RepID=A0ABU4RMU1_9HYPH|nr:penicillin-binding protein 1A [Terrihabitans sp. PJ23]MDX6805419.1 penicillin-binding protein 1A [Terrihabitans sp. PJ23]
MRLLIRFFGFVFATAAILGVVAAAGVAIFVWQTGRDLPNHTALQNYEPPVITRLHASDGSMIGEYANQRRLFLPIQAVPQLVLSAFISAEDKNFYQHSGIDFTGIARAALAFVEHFGTDRRPQGASTITQQVAKNFLLTNELSMTRKIKEALLSMRIEQTFSKDKILELYVNEIYLGLGNYGIAAAALNYFDKSVHELNIAEVAYLAALPKAPNNYNPFRQTDRAIERRNWVIDRMVENGYVKPEDAQKAKDSPLGVIARAGAPHNYTAPYYSEEVRRVLYEKYGAKGLYEGGLSVRTALEPQLQELAKKALTDGLVKFDEARGWRGPVKHIELGADWGPALAEVPALNDVSWQLAVVIGVQGNQVAIGLQPGREGSGAVKPDRETGTIPTEGLKWARWASGVEKPANLKGPVQPGDVVYVEPLKTKSGEAGQYRLRQPPEISGAMAVMDPFTGRVLALVGGFSYAQSEFNRGTQALRQPGSSFKPLIYAAALENGYTPSSLVLDAPIEIAQGSGQEDWKPENYGNDFNGPSTLRYGIEKSRNVMTVRLAQDMGMPIITEYARRFGAYDDLPPFLSMALGAGETTLLRMVSSYSVFANGGKKVTPSLIDRIQDRYGRTVYRHDERECQGCRATDWRNQQPPTLADHREQILDPLTAYQMTSIMEGAVLRGTGTALREVGKPVAGKTGTTNDYKDAWFVGFSPDLVVGVYLGYDKPRGMGKSATGGGLAAPVAAEFMKMALADKPAVPFRVPAGIKLVRINPATGMRAGPGDQRVILEAFKPGTAPPDNYTVIGGESYEGQAVNVTPEAAGRSVRTGTGGLY